MTKWSASSHRWRFFRSGGLDQVRLENSTDLLALETLDQKLWAALSCPTRGLAFDNKTLDFIDTNKDGRIRVPEIVAAVQWACAMLKNPDDLTLSEAALPLSAINDNTPEGKQLLASARQILKNLCKDHHAAISAEDTADTAKIFAHTRFNGDGIVLPEASDDASLQQCIQDIIACCGSELDRSGENGVSRPLVEQFFKAARAYSQWWTLAESDAANVLPLADATEMAAAAFKAVQPKVDDFFARCRLAAFDARAAGPLNRAKKEYVALAQQLLSASVGEVADFPLAKIEAGRALPLSEGLNPAWSNAIAALCAHVTQPLLGARDQLTDKEWALLTARFQAYELWLTKKDGATVERLGLARVRALLAGNTEQRILDLIAQDMALEPEANAIVAVDKLVHFYRDLFHLLNNFVSLRDFYSGKSKAVFQAGTLYLDGRSCELCIRVDDVAKHSALATLSRIYLAYCECSRPDSSEKITIAAAFTAGDSDQLMTGRNGVFYDRAGRDWDAVIIKIIEHPISIRQAFWSPYKRIGRMVGEQIEKLASSRDKTTQDQAAAAIASAGQKLDGAKAAAPVPFDVAKFAGIFAAIGLAVGALGTAFASIVTGFLGLKLWQMPLALVGLVLILSGPSMLIAALKLRQRNLGPLLDANGWAVNTRAKINLVFGRALTDIAKLPVGSERSLEDPFAEKTRPWGVYLFLLAVALLGLVLWQQGHIAKWLNLGEGITTLSTPAEPTQ
ncbi:MAG: hypothetical protein HY273_00670 [Gammaproteobacteria bacterium]|nr:hypothetical protein [Gammaproteobacteria bacterium]